MRLPLNQGMARFWAEGPQDLKSVPRGRGVFAVAAWDQSLNKVLGRRTIPTHARIKTRVNKNRCLYRL